jgi:hypothetical protein
MFLVPRTCKEKVDKQNEQYDISHPIDYFRERSAYVLLGEPGAGKSSLFEAEADNTPDGVFISAREFTIHDPEKWQDKTLFIDGLDEARASNGNTLTPLDDIRRGLIKLGCKRFRISCRAADWLGSLDTRDIKMVSPDKNITVLYLDPLSSDDIDLILQNDLRVSDAKDFLKNAEHFGLLDLLDNPQTLDMLIVAVKGGQQWPTSKLEVYDLASKQLAAEFNVDHALVQKQPATTPQILDAAGFLCAIQIIANVTGFTETQTITGRTCLNDLKIPNELKISNALKTRLFTKTNTDEFNYIHRSVAEYLAAQFIANKIKEGLLFNRVLALTTGFDGGIVAALRGLMAWLSVLSTQACERLIEIDPVGVIINGDASPFPKSVKSQLYRALVRESKTTDFLNLDWHTTAFASITTNDMTAELSQILNNPSRNDGEQSLMVCLLKGLSCSETITEIKVPLLRIMRDNSYWETIRSNALSAFIHQYPEDLDSLLALADEIRLGIIEDTEKGFMEILLDKLFPLKIHASNIFNYLLPHKNNRIISYYYFWKTKLSNRLTNDDLAIVLDQLSDLETSFLEHKPDVIIHTVGQILIRGLQVHGLNISPERLYKWLSIDIDQYDSCKLPVEQRLQINNWLNANPDRYLAIIGAGLKQIKNFENISWEINKVFVRLHDAMPPSNIAQWWLNQALSESNFNLSCAYFEQAFVTLYRPDNNDLSLEYFVNWLADHPEYNETYQTLIFRPIPESRLKRADSTKSWLNKRDEEQNKKLSYLHEHLAQIAEGSAAPQIFNELGRAFNHGTQTIGKSRDDRLSEYLNNDEILIEAAKSGLRKILYRTDLPTPNEVFTSAAKNGEWHFIRLPFLVCMNTLYQKNPAILETLSNDLLSVALAFCFTEGLYNEAWLKSLCHSKPELVAMLFTDYVTVLLAGKSQFIHGLHNLVYEPDFLRIAKLTVIPLLKQYPVRGYKNHADHLRYLLNAAIANIDKAELLTLIEKKLGYTSMDLAQQIFWLTTGLIIAPDLYEAKIRSTVLGKNERINHLFNFLYPSLSSKMYDRYDFPVSTKRMLIELFAPRCNPIWARGGGIVTRAMEERDYVRYLINNLADNPSEESATILADLLKDATLSTWHKLLQNAQQTQLLNRREALFKHANATQVINTLSNSKPANVADLAVLTVDCLKQLAADIQGSSNDSYTEFWNVDTHYGTPEIPRPENICRIPLVNRLKPMLAKYDVQVELESHQHNSKRVDIKLSVTSEGKTLQLPIEIKCDSNKKLWKTIHEQLIPFYTVAPETGGRGVYLVIWFNHEKLPTHPQGLPLPKTSEQLSAMLQETMTPQEQKLIDVFVLDVSRKP